MLAEKPDKLPGHSSKRQNKFLLLGTRVVFISDVEGVEVGRA